MSDRRNSSPVARAEKFANRLGIRIPILLAPMAGACPPSLSIAVADAGGLGGCGALMMQPNEIRSWGDEFRRGSKGEFQINLWVPEPPPPRDFELERQDGSFWRSGDRPYHPKRVTRNCPILKRSARRC